MRFPIVFLLTTSLVATAAALASAAALAGASALAASAEPPALPDLASYALVRPDSGTPLSVDQAADMLKDYDVVFVGELHDHTGNHLAEMALFRALHARAPALALSMEQFERDVQPVLDDYLAGRIGEDALRQKGRAWGNYAEAYRPLVEYAKAHALPVIAANAPGKVVLCVGAEGPEFLSRMKPAERGWAAAELHTENGPYKDKFLRFLAEDPLHGRADADKSAGPSAADLRSFAAQVTRDDTMAESIALYLEKHPGGKVVHIAGDFHVESFLGTVERLKSRAPNLKVAVVAPVEVENPDRAASRVSDKALGTLLVLLRELPKEYATEAEKNADIAEQRKNFRVRTTCAL